MDVIFNQTGETLIAKINGDIDHHSSKIFKEKIDNEIEKKNVKNLMFDFSGVSFMDSSGLGVVIGRYKNIQKTGGKVGVVSLSPQMDRIFEISGLFKIISKYEDISTGLKEINN